MKILKITIASAFLLFMALQFISFKSTSSVEDYQYDVIDSVEDIEIRNYKNALFSKVELSSDKYEKISGTGFRILAGYIFGGNETSENISMTSPVVVEMGDSKSMMFMIPNNHNLATMPEPNNENISFIEIPSKKMAVIQFGGWANQKKINKYIDELKRHHGLDINALYLRPIN